MMHNLLFMSLSIIIMGVITFIHKRKKRIKLGTMASLFLFGILLSIPFVLIEHLAFNIKYYLVIMAFIAIELIITAIEHKWEYLHHLIHHNIKELRLLSFFIVSLGFTYSELSFYIFNSTEPLKEVIFNLPIKALFALFIHTVLTSSAAVLTTTESIVENVVMFLFFYLRLIFISVSHYLYAFFTENSISLLLIPFLAYNIYLLFKHKRYLDRKGEIIA